MARLTIVVDVPDADPPHEDPHEVADEILDDPAVQGVRNHRFVYAEWGDMIEALAERPSGS